MKFSILTSLTLALAGATALFGAACDVADTGESNAERQGKASSPLCGGEDSYIDENGEEVICIYTEEPYDPPQDPCFLYPEFCNPEPPDPCEVNPEACNPPDPGGGGDPEPPPEEGKCVYYQQLSYTGFAESYTPGHESMVATTEAAFKDAKDKCVLKESDPSCQRACLSLKNESSRCQWIDTVWPFWDYWHCVVSTDYVTNY